MTEQTVKVTDIAYYIREARNVSFVIGAGASISAGIPLASKLIEMIHERFDHRLRGLSKKELGDYGAVMGRLDPGNRKDLIVPLLEKAKINWGHIALASLIKSTDNISRILSFNFDLLPEKAASLLGMHLPVYDFAVAPSGEIRSFASPAIFHLHGQSYGLKLLNTGKETGNHKEAYRSLVSDSLKEHLTIVIGYSGEADAAINLFNEEFDSRSTLLWLGYEKTPSPHLKTLLQKDFAFYVGGCDFDLTMIKIAQDLGCFPPEIITNPPRHLLAELSDVTNFPVNDQSGPDIVSPSKDRLEALASEWDERNENSPAKKALLAGTDIAPSDNPETDTEEEKEARAWIFIRNGDEAYSEAYNLKDEDARQKWREAIAYYQKASDVKWNINQTHNNWGNALAALAKAQTGEEQLTSFQTALEKYENALAITSNDYITLTNWGLTLSDLSKIQNGKERKASLEQAIEKYTTALKINPKFHHTLFNCGEALRDLADLQKGDERKASLESAIEKFEIALEAKPEDFEALNNLGAALIEIAVLQDGREKRESLQNAIEKFNAALKINPKDSITLCYLALTFRSLALTPDEKEPETLLKKAISKYKTALAIETDNHHIYYYLGVTLLKLSSFQKNEEASKTLSEALAASKQAKKNSGKANYILACVYAILGHIEEALNELEDCATDAELPKLDELNSDTDLDNLRDEPRFKALLASLEEDAA